MRRIALILATLGILCLAAGQAQAHAVPLRLRRLLPRLLWAGGGPSARLGRSAGGRAGPGLSAGLSAPVLLPCPAAGFYYRGPGLSIGVGF